MSADNLKIHDVFHCKVKELLQWRITGLNVNITTQYECVSCLVIAIIVAFVVVIHLQCLVSVDLSLVKIKYSVCVKKIHDVLTKVVWNLRSGKKAISFL